ncbi:hypothetical protein Tco_0700463 [Tanacetum coccineum]
MVCRCSRGVAKDQSYADVGQGGGSYFNGHFFWIDASVCPIFVPWHNSSSVKRDLLPSDDLVDFPLMEGLNLNRNLIRRYPKEFLCIIGLSRSFVELDVRPTLLGPDKNVKSADPFKVKVGERTLAEGEVPLLTENAYLVVVSSDKMVRPISHMIADEIREHSGKNKRKVGFSTVPPPVKKVRMGVLLLLSRSGSAAPHAEEFVSFYVTSTPNRRDHEDSSSTHYGYVRTRHAYTRYVVLTSSSEHEGVDTVASPKTTSPKVGSPNPHVHMRVKDVGAGAVNETVNTSLPENDADAASLPGNRSQTIGTATAQYIYVLHWDVTNDAQLDEPVMCRNSIDHMHPPGFWASLHNRHDADFLDILNVNSAQHACMVSELRLRYEHEILTRETSEQKFMRGCEIIQQRDAEIVAKLETDCESLRDEVVGEAKLREEFLSMQDAAAKRFDERSANREAMGKVISLAIDNGIQEGLEVGIEHGKAGRSLSEVAAYDSGVGMPLPLLEQLEALKDSSLELLMSALTLEGIMRGGSRGPDSISHEILLSEALAASRAHCEQHQKARLEVGGLSQSSQRGSLVVADPPASGAANIDGTVPLHDDMFDATILDKPSDS